MFNGHIDFFISSKLVGTVITNSEFLFNGMSNSHIVLTIVSNGPFYVYINGVIACQGQFKSYLPTLRDNTDNYLGGNQDDSFIGYINEFRVWNSILSPSDVLVNFNQGIVLVLFRHFLFV